MSVEVHPRRRPAHPMLRILIAVLAGAAAMNAISAYQAKPARAPKPSAAKPKPQPPPPKLDMPAPRPPQAPRPAPSSMLIKPESGAAASGGFSARRLETRGWKSEFSRAGSNGINRGFSDLRFQQPQARPSGPPVSAKAAPKLLATEPLPEQEIAVSSAFDPEILPEKAFWTQERLLSVIGSAFVALLGVLYILMTAFPKPKPDQPS